MKSDYDAAFAEVMRWRLHWEYTNVATLVESSSPTNYRAISSDSSSQELPADGSPQILLLPPSPSSFVCAPLDNY